MSITELREKAPDALKVEVEEICKQLMEARFKLAAHQLEDTALFRRLKHRLAQIKTVLSEKKQ